MESQQWALGGMCDYVTSGRGWDQTWEDIADSAICSLSGPLERLVF